MKVRVNTTMHSKVFLCWIPLLPQPSLFLGLGSRSEYAGLHTLRAGLDAQKLNSRRSTENTKHVTDILPHMSTGLSSLSLASFSRDLRCCILSTIMEASSSESAHSELSTAVGGVARVAFVSAVFSLSNYNQPHKYSTR